jgi:hypothetical protein
MLSYLSWKSFSLFHRADARNNLATIPLLSYLFHVALTFLGLGILSLMYNTSTFHLVEALMHKEIVISSPNPH